MTYACPVYNNCAFRHFNKIQIKQNKILRMILDANMFDTTESLHNRTNIPFIRDFVDKLNESFYSRALSHENNLISTLGNYANCNFLIKHHLPKIL